MIPSETTDERKVDGRTGDEQAVVQQFLDSGDATGWFDKIYASANGDGQVIPWACLAPRPAFADWLSKSQLDGSGKRAVVIGCGLGDDAEALAACGFKVTAFDISQTAVDWCKQRFPDSPVEYVVADLFAPPTEWRDGFDFVFECFTVQALPISMRENTIHHVTNLVAPNGTLLLITMGHEQPEDRPGPPWPLTRDEVDTFIENGLTELKFEDLPRKPEQSAPLWRVVYQRGGKVV